MPLPTKNAVLSSSRPSGTYWGLGLALLAVLSLRLWFLAGAGLPDYDSVRNWQLFQELASGDGHSMFLTAGPGFNLFYALLACFTTDFRVFQLVNALLSVAGLGLFAAFVVRASAEEEGRPWRGAEAAALVLLGGTGLLLSFSGRDLTSVGGGAVLAAGLLRSHYHRVQAGPLADRRAALLRSAVWLAAGLCYSYKFLLIVPILGALEVLRADGAAWQGATKWQVLLRLAWPYAVLMAVGALWAGLPWYRWPAIYVRLVLPAEPNPAGRQLVLNPDLFYYFRYLLAFESPLLLPGLVAGGWLGWRQWRAQPAAGGRALPLLLYLGVWAGCWLAGMALLQKAPRGLQFAYLPLAALVMLGLRRLPGLWGRLGALILLASLGLNSYRLWQHLYRYPPSNYPAAAAWLRAHGARRVAGTVGVGLAPYLPAAAHYVGINDERQLGALRRQGYDYVVLDAYWRVANVARFDSLRRQRPAAAWPEARLTEPLLFLEHSEFTGFNFSQTLGLQQQAAQDSLQLRIYRLQ